jgi:hypothetical protein
MQAFHEHIDAQLFFVRISISFVINNKFEVKLTDCNSMHMHVHLFCKIKFTFAHRVVQVFLDADAVSKHISIRHFSKYPCNSLGDKQFACNRRDQFESGLVFLLC